MRPPSHEEEEDAEDAGLRTGSPLSSTPPSFDRIHQQKGSRRRSAPPLERARLQQVRRHNIRPSIEQFSALPVVVLRGEHQGVVIVILGCANGRPRLEQGQSAPLVTVLAGEHHRRPTVGLGVVGVGSILEQCPSALLVTILASDDQGSRFLRSAASTAAPALISARAHCS